MLNLFKKSASKEQLWILQFHALHISKNSDS